MAGALAEPSASEGKLAKASNGEEGVSSAANALALPPAPGANTGVSGSTEPIQPVMSRMARFCAAKPERSATMIWFGVTTKGLPDVFTPDRPASNLAVLRIQLPGPKLTVSAPPPKLTRPPNRAPGSTVRMSEAARLPLNRIAVPLRADDGSGGGDVAGSADKDADARAAGAGGPRDGAGIE